MSKPPWLEFYETASINVLQRSLDDLNTANLQDKEWIIAASRYPAISQAVLESFQKMDRLTASVNGTNLYYSMQPLIQLLLWTNLRLKNILKEPFIITNHMVTFTMTFSPFLPQKKLDLTSLLRLVPGSSPFSETSIQLSLPQSNIIATLTENGKVNMVGGNNRTALLTATTMFLGQIQDACLKIDQMKFITLGIASLGIRNYVAASKLKTGTFFDIYHTSCLARQLNIVHSYQPEGINQNQISFHPFPHGPHIRVYPTGGIVATGASTVYDLILAIELVCALLYPFIEFIPFSRFASPPVASGTAPATAPAPTWTRSSSKRQLPPPPGPPSTAPPRKKTKLKSVPTVITACPPKMSSSSR